jgi:hypothetical protein
MRAVFTIVSLLVVLAIVGVLARKQMGAGVSPRAGVSGSAAPATPQQQVQDYKKSIEGAMQQSRPARDDTQ